MSHTIESKKVAGAKPKRIVKLSLDSATKHYSSPPHREADAFYEGRLTSVSGMTRGIDIIRAQAQMNEGSFSLQDNDGVASELVRDNVIDGKVGEVLLGFDDSGTLVSENVTKGLMEVRRINTSGNPSLDVAIKTNTRDKIGIMQRGINKTDFPNAPDSTIGQGLNIILGEVTASTRSSGAVYCPIVDTTSYKLCIAQHGIHSASNFIKVKGDVVTNITPASTTLYETDSSGNAIATATLNVGDYDAEALYFCDAEGLVSISNSFVTLDGVNDRYASTPAESPMVPGRTGYTDEFTIEAKIRLASTGTARTLCAVWQTATANRSWSIGIDATEKVTVRLSPDGTGATVYTATGNTVLGTGSDYTIRAVFNSSGFTLYVNGTAQTLSTSGSLPTSIFAADANYTVGNNSVGGTSRFAGRIYYVVMSKNAVDFTGGAANYRTVGGALEDIINEQIFDHTGDDIQNNNTVTPTSLVWPTDYTTVQETRNPIFATRQMLLKVSGLKSTDISETKFVEFAATMNSRGYNTAGEWGGCVPWNPGDIVTDSYLTLQKIALSTDGVFYTQRDGKLAVTTGDISDVQDTTSASITIHDLTSNNVSIDKARFTSINNMRGRYGRAHKLNSHENIRGAKDKGAISEKGQTEEIIVDYEFIRGIDTVEDVMRRYLLRRAGDTLYVSTTINGYQFFNDFDLGDYVDITHSHILGGWDAKQFKVTHITDNIMSAQMPIKLASVGDVFGPIEFAGEETITLSPTIDTYVSENASERNTAYGSATTMRHGDKSVDNATYRSALRFDLSDIDSAGGTIISATLQTFFETAINPDFIVLRQLSNTTWGNNSTWNNFSSDGAGAAWTDTEIGATSLSNQNSNTGTKTFILNSDGITYLNSVIGGTNTAQLTFNSLDSGSYYILSSNDSSNSARRPALTITYST